MKKDNLIFWITTSLIFLFEGVMPALTSQSKMAQDGILHLGYPIYFGTILAVFKVLGTLVLIIPRFDSKLKEWAYAGFAFDFIFAFLSLLIVDGVSAMLLMPIIFMGILMTSYYYFHKIKSGN